MPFSSQTSILILLSLLCIVEAQYYGYSSSYGPQRYGSYYSSPYSYNYNYNNGMYNNGYNNGMYSGYSSYPSSYSSYSYPSSYSSSSYTSPYYGYNMSPSYSMPSLGHMGYRPSGMRIGNDLAAIYLTCSTCGRGK